MIGSEVPGADEQDERREAARIDVRGIRPPAAYAIAERDAPDGVAVVAVEGELDLAAAPALRVRIDGALGMQALVVDLGRATFVDSAVLKELLRARAELAARDARFVLAAVPPPVRRLLDLTGTSELFEDAPDLTTALTRLSA